MARTIIYFAFLVLGVSLVWTQSSKPNIVYIMGDDLGWNDVGFHNPKVKTPNIDKLHAKGIELTSNYVQYICTASRSALLTGRYPIHNGMQHLVLMPEIKSCLPLEFKLLPQYMKDEGYATKMVGKWHLGYCTEECLPHSRGFDSYKGIIGAECDYWKWEHAEVFQRYANNTPETSGLGNTHVTVLDQQDVREQIMAHKGNSAPLFMYVSPTAPHSPLQPTESMYNVHDFLDPNDASSNSRRKYLGLVSGLDDLVGTTVQAIEDAGMADNTIIIFQSDNGGSSIQPPQPGFESTGNNYPLRAGKFAVYEGGVKTPTVYYDPRLSESTRGTKRNFLMHVSDWMPTFLGLAKSEKIPTDIDGKNQVSNLEDLYIPIFSRYRVRDRFLVNMDTMNGIDSIFNCTNRDAAFRYRDWKLVYGVRSTYTYDEDSDQDYRKPAESPELPTITGDKCATGDIISPNVRCLFNIRDDPSETKNLYYDYPKIVNKILGMIDDAKKTMVHHLYDDQQDHTDENTQTLAGTDLLIPKFGYCNPSVDFPLTPISEECKTTTEGPPGGSRGAFFQALKHRVKQTIETIE